jgi:ATP-dependent Clp protease ATP-binding subunit ClpA
MQLAKQSAAKHGQQLIEIPDVVCGIFNSDENVAISLFRNMGLNIGAILSRSENLLEETSTNQTIVIGVSHSHHVKKLIETAITEAKNLQHGYVGTEHLVLAILGTEEGPKLLGTNYEYVRQVLALTQQGEEPEPEPPTIEEGEEEEEVNIILTRNLKEVVGLLESTLEDAAALQSKLDRIQNVIDDLDSISDSKRIREILEE